MNNLETTLIASFYQLRETLINDGADSSDLSIAAAILVLADQIKCAQGELNRIAQVLGADFVKAKEIAQSDVPDNMLSLLSALKATTQGPA